MERGNLSHCTGGAVCRVTAPDRPSRGITRSFPASLLDTSDYTAYERGAGHVPAQDVCGRSNPNRICNVKGNLFDLIELFVYAVL